MSKTILIIDDNPSDQDLIKEIIAQSELDVNVQTAETGEEGIEQAKQHKPDLVFIDAAMPGMDGFQVCRALKQQNDLNSNIVMVTGKLKAFDKEKAVEAGADDYILKLADVILDKLTALQD